MEKAIITGATSFIGCALVKYLLSENIKVFAIVRPLSKGLASLPKHDNLEIINADISECNVWSKKIEKADLFFHLGWGGIGAEGRANPEIQANNVLNTKLCIEYADILSCRTFLFAGSQAEYGPTNEILNEESPCNAITEYGKAKNDVYSVARQIVPKLNLNYIHTRIFSVYGTGDHEWALVPACIKAFCADENISLSSCEQMWNYLHVSDCVKMMYRLSQRRDLDKCEVFNVASNITRPLYEFVEEIKKVCGSGKPLYNVRKLGLEPPFGINPDISKLINITRCFPEINFSDGISELVLTEKSKKENRI